MTAFKITLQTFGLSKITCNPMGQLRSKMFHKTFSSIYVGQSSKISKMSLNSSTYIFSYLLDVVLHSKSYLVLKTQNQSCHSKVITFWKVVKTTTKGFISFVWVYLQINICDFRLFLLDHCITPHLLFYKMMNQKVTVFIHNTVVGSCIYNYVVCVNIRIHTPEKSGIPYFLQ